MRIQSLSIKNIGLFNVENLTFIHNDYDNLLNPPVIIFTGENGTGKSIILDAIRALLIGPFTSYQIERLIVRNVNDFSIKLNVSLDYKSYKCLDHPFSLMFKVLLRKRGLL